MSPELSAASIAAVATIVAALIAGAISFVNLTLTKEQKVSDFRQAWIDGLRNDLAMFFAAIRSFARASQETSLAQKSTDSRLAITQEKVSELRYQVAEARCRIQLRLNLKEKEHQELLRLMQCALDKQQEVIRGQGTTEDTLRAVEVAASFAPEVLKLEWERVKQGELAFRIARNWIAPAVVILSIVFVVMLWNGKVEF